MLLTSSSVVYWAFTTVLIVFVAQSMQTDVMVTAKDMYIACTASRFPRLTDCFDNNFRCYLMWYGIYSMKDRKSFDYDGLLYHDAKTRANVVVALGVNSSLAIQANTDDCSEYKIFLQLTYTQPYNQSFDYCQRPSEMWYYSELAADFNRQMSTMPSSDKEKCNGKTCEITVSAG